MAQRTDDLTRSRRTLLWLITSAAALEFVLQSANAFWAEGPGVGIMWAAGAVAVAGLAYSIEIFKRVGID